ncbi:MAG: glycosyltransferase family 4 protein [Henriciella sp.]
MLDLTKQTQIMPRDQARSDDRLRICLLSYRSDPKVGGQGVYVDYLSSALAKAGAQVDVVSGPPYPTLSADVNLVKLPSLDLFSKPHHGHYELRPRHLLSPTDTYEYVGHLSGKFVEPFTFGQRAYQYLKRHRGKYDIVLDNQTLAHGIGRIHHRLDLPLTTMIHHPITRDLKLAVEAAPDWKHRWLARRWYSFVKMQIKVARKLPAITCPSEHAKADIVSEFGVAPERIHPISLGVDQQTFCPNPKTAIATDKIITTASADTPLKGLHILVEAYHKLLDTHPELKLTVIGKLRKGLARNAILKFGLKDRIEFKSDLTREELADEFRSATVAVTPSLYEGFGLPAAEAMSCGTPVVVTDGGALPEVAGKAGIVVPKGDPVALADAIDALISNPERRAETAQACLKHAQAQFNWDNIAPKYLDFFHTAMAAQC